MYLLFVVADISTTLNTADDGGHGREDQQRRGHTQKPAPILMPVSFLFMPDLNREKAVY
jgi:hypothetical protein